MSTPHDRDIDRAFAEKPPIVLIGTHRSGTTFLGDALGRQPDIAYWIEPRHVWVRGNAYTPDDRLDAAHARPAVRAAIRRSLDAYTRRLGKSRLAEKTPSNCLRIPFIHAVLPEARILIILRDGRSVLRSTGEIMARGMPTSRILQRALETHPADWPAEFGRLASAVTRKLTRQPLKYWGPRPPGWRDWIGLGPDALLAHQWAASINAALDDAASLQPEAAFTFRYEDLMRQPEHTARRIAEFCRLADPDALAAFITAEADPARADKWRDELSRETLDAVEPIMRPTLERLGYRWESP